MRSNSPIFSFLFVTILTSTTLPIFAQEWRGWLEERLPTIETGCNSQTDKLVSTTEHELSADSYPARYIFKKRIPGFNPKGPIEPIASLQTELRQLFDNMKPGGTLPIKGEQLLSGLSEEMQKFIKANYQVPESRALTGLLVFMTDRSGKLQWCLFYYIFVDHDAIRRSAALSAEKTTDDKLIITILGRDIDRTKLSSATAIVSDHLNPYFSEHPPG